MTGPEIEAFIRERLTRPLSNNIGFTRACEALAQELRTRLVVIDPLTDTIGYVKHERKTDG